jgi:hypothetical protein
MKDARLAMQCGCAAQPHPESDSESDSESDTKPDSKPVAGPDTQAQSDQRSAPVTHHHPAAESRSERGDRPAR